MDVQKILESKDNLIQFLKDKGFNQEKDYPDEGYKEGTFFKIDKRKLLVIYEIVDEEKLKEVKDHFLIDRGLSYCIIIYNHKLIFFRSFGEKKHFIYSERTKNNRSKIDKLEKIRESIDALFKSKDISAVFYEQFKTKRNLLVQHIKNDIDPTEKFLIAQKIFDRFFFIYFLCHKGIIKFKDGGKISGENLFSKILLKKGDFLPNLKSLFRLFNAQEKEILKIGGYEIAIPYLNGGLFRPDVLEQDLDISLKNEQWEAIFVFLNSYHWIIEDVKASEENEDKILTPEILGHVYERSVVEWEQKGFEEEAEEAAGKKVTERKKKGVYYTPETITDYISNNTIVPYLLDKLDNKFNSFEGLVESKDKKEWKRAVKILEEIKVLDPACGSGAFLIKGGEVIFGLKRRLLYLLGDKSNFYDLKLDIITENIYGVDILTGAIEIAKLRLWLWLISDYEESKNKIKALPNIEYNLKVGNSLVGWLDEKLVQIPLNTPLTDEVKGILRGLRVAFNGEQKEDIGKVKMYLEGYKLNDYIEAYYLLYRIYRKSHGEEAEDLRKILETIRESIYKSVTPAFLEFVNFKIAGIEYGKSHKEQSAKYKSLRNKPPITEEEFSKLQVFHWRIDFGHIIKEGGFDVVVGNPPYFSGITLSKEEIKLLSGLFGDLWAARNDISYYFVLRSLSFLRGSCYLGFIFPRYYIKSHYAKNFRNFLKFHVSLIQILDTENFQVFQDANILTTVTIINKRLPENHKLKFIRIKSWDGNIEELFHVINSKLEDEEIQQLEISQSELSEESWEFVSQTDSKLIENIRKKSIQLVEFCDIGKGMSTGFNAAYEISKLDIRRERLESKGLRKIIKNGDIRRYHVNPERGEVIYLQNVSNINKFPNIKKHLLKFKEDLGDRKNYTGPWYKYTTPRNIDIFDSKKERVVVPFMATENRFAIDYDRSIPTSGDVHAILFKSEYQKYTNLFLGILNSKLIMWFHKKTTQLKRAGYIEFNKKQLEKLPIAKFPEKGDKDIMKLVHNILKVTKSKDYSENKQKQRKVQEIQEQIDKLVYKLYDLTLEEIEIVEGIDGIKNG